MEYWNSIKQFISPLLFCFRVLTSDNGHTRIQCRVARSPIHHIVMQSSFVSLIDPWAGLCNDQITRSPWSAVARFTTARRQINTGTQCTGGPRPGQDCITIRWRRRRSITRLCRVRTARLQSHGRTVWEKSVKRYLVAGIYTHNDAGDGWRQFRWWMALKIAVDNGGQAACMQLK